MDRANATKRNAIRGLESSIETSNYLVHLRIEHAKAILCILKERQEHVFWKPVKALGGPGYPYNDLECSGCGYRTKMIPEGWSYCPHCGRPVEI